MIFYDYSTLILLSAIITATAEFVALNESPQNFTSIELGLECPTESIGTRVNQIHWTVVPVEASVVTVSSQPAELVDAIVENGVLKFDYNDVSLSTHNEGTGVRIDVPSDQLEDVVAVGIGFAAQVLPGFLNLTSVIVQSSVSVLSFLSEGQVDFEGTGDKNVVHLAGNVESLTLSGNDNVVNVGGSIESGEVSGANALLNVAGAIGELTVSGTNTLVSAPSCDNVILSGASNYLCIEMPIQIDVTTIDDTSTEELRLWGREQLGAFGSRGKQYSFCYRLSSFSSFRLLEY